MRRKDISKGSRQYNLWCRNPSNFFFKKANYPEQNENLSVKLNDSPHNRINEEDGWGRPVSWDKFHRDILSLKNKEKKICWYPHRKQVIFKGFPNQAGSDFSKTLKSKRWWPSPTVLRGTKHPTVVTMSGKTETFSDTQDWLCPYLSAPWEFSKALPNWPRNESK